MSIWQEFVDKALARRCLENERTRYKRSFRRGGPQKVSEGESAQQRRRREYLSEVGREEVRHG
jgi:hypothetical protein